MSIKDFIKNYDHQVWAVDFYERMTADKKGQEALFFILSREHKLQVGMIATMIMDAHQGQLDILTCESLAEKNLQELVRYIRMTESIIKQGYWQ